MPKVCVFLGAGFSVVGGVPLASQLFDHRPEIDRITRERLIDRVLDAWNSWKSRTGGAPEEYLAHLETHGILRQWHDAVWYVSLVVALSMGTIREIGHTAQRTIIQTNVNRTPGIRCHEDFWDALFGKTDDVVVITTNYDVLAERGLRNTPRPRRRRPGFHYGMGPELLNGSGAPSYSHIRPIMAAGRIPLFKLHGSVSWSLERDQIVHYFDCRPAIQGKALIVAPVKEKTVPPYFRPLWEKAADALRKSQTWIVIGYSFPPYDETINRLFSSNSGNLPAIHVFDPDPNAAARVRHLIPNAAVVEHPGLPDGIPEMEAVF